MATIILLISTSIALSFPIALTPSNAAIWVLFIAFILTINFAINYRSWISLIIFLIYIGGMLVIFSYFSALSPNTIIPNNPLIFAAIYSLTIISTLFIISKIHISNFTSTPSASHSITISSIYFPRTSIILIITALILFFTIVRVVKISKRNIGPLRPFAYEPTHSKNSSCY